MIEKNRVMSAQLEALKFHSIGELIEDELLDKSATQKESSQIKD